MRAGSMMLPEPRPAIRQIAEVVHGALDFAELEGLGLAADEIVDFSVNGNPYGPAPAVQEAITTVRVDRYPDRAALALHRALARQLGLAPERVLAGNGSMELVWLIALAFLRPGDAVLSLQPTFGEYARAALLMGAQFHACTALPETNFQVDIDAVSDALQRLAPRLMVICNPNNPTGTYLPVETIATWAAAAPQSLFVVDEAYLTFAQSAPSMVLVQPDNVLVLRSMTKAYALAGLRLGYAVGHPELLNMLRKVCPPWSVNAVAQAAGIAALSDTTHLDTCLSRLDQAKVGLMENLRTSGWEPMSSTTHFFLLRVDDATACRQALLQQGLLVRDCTSFGLPAYIRIATRGPDENDRLVAALGRLR